MGLLQSCESCALSCTPSRRYIYFLNVNIKSGGGDVFHCELCVGLLLRGATISGNKNAVQVGGADG